MSEFLQHVEAEIQNRRLFKPGDKLLVAVSGGIDSMVLFHALKVLSARHQWKLVVAHFNHRLRGRASDADERLVRKTAAAMKLPFATGSADVKAFAAKSKLSLEMAARKLRHEFLALAARKRKIKTIALAHHAGDQVELFFLRLFRGAGGEGLAGMKWRSPSPADPKITLIRPLLGFSKSELLAFARERKFQFREDATNYSSDFLRNRVRNKLLPLLRKNYQPALDKAVLRLMKITGAEADFAGEAARDVVSSLRLDTVRPQAERYTFEKLPVAVQRRVLRLQLAELGVIADFELIESLRQTPDVFVSAGQNISVSRNQSGEIKLRTDSDLEFNAGELSVDLSGRTGKTVFDGVKFNWNLRAGAAPVGRASSRAGSLGASPHHIKMEFFDADKVGSKIMLRHWRPGDRFQPIGLKSAAKLQDLFVNAKISAACRRDLVLAAVTDDKIFWVEGLRISERFKLTPDTKRRLVWRWQVNSL